MARSHRGRKNVEKPAVDGGQIGKVGERDTLVDLVHGLADEAELGDRAIGVDEARVRRAAGRAEFGIATGHRANRTGQAIADGARRHQERFAADFPGERVRRADRIEPFRRPFSQFIAGPQIVETDVERGPRLAGNDVGRRIARYRPS